MVAVSPLTPTVSSTRSFLLFPIPILITRNWCLQEGYWASKGSREPGSHRGFQTCIAGHRKGLFFCLFFSTWRTHNFLVVLFDTKRRARVHRPRDAANLTWCLISGNTALGGGDPSRRELICGIAIIRTTTAVPSYLGHATCGNLSPRLRHQTSFPQRPICICGIRRHTPPGQAAAAVNRGHRSGVWMGLCSSWDSHQVCIKSGHPVFHGFCPRVLYRLLFLRFPFFFCRQRGRG